MSQIRPVGKSRLLGDVEVEMYDLDIAEMLSLWNFMNKDTILSGAQRLLDGVNFASGIELTRPNGTEMFGEDFVEFIQEHFSALGPELNMIRKALGLTLVRFTVNEDGETVPEIPVLGTFLIRFFFDETGRIQFLFYPIGGDQPLTDIIVPSYRKPIYDDKKKRFRFNSVIYEEWERSRLVETNYENAMKATATMAQPPVPLMWNLANAQMSRLGQNGNAKSLQTADETIYTKTTEDLAVTSDLMETALDLMHDRLQAENMRQEIVFNRPKNAAENDVSSRQVLLPPNFTVAAIQPPTIGMDPLAFERVRDKRKLIAMGIPESIFYSDSSVQANIVGHDNLFRITVDADRLALIREFTRIYYYMYGETDIQDAIAKLEEGETENSPHERGSKRSEPSPEEVQRVRKETRVKFNLPGIPTVGQDRLDQLYTNQIITREGYIALSCKANGVPDNYQEDPEAEPVEPPAAKKPKQEAKATEASPKEEKKSKDPEDKEPKEKSESKKEKPKSESASELKKREKDLKDKS